MSKNHRGLQDKVTFNSDDAANLARDLGTAVNGVFGEYLGQEIDVKTYPDGVHVTGECVLTGYRCLGYTVDPQYTDACHGCDIYKRHFPTLNYSP